MDTAQAIDQIPPDIVQNEPTSVFIGEYIYI